LQKGYSMYEVECERLIDYLKQMISDGVQLVHAGQTIDWNDTKVPEQILKIIGKKERAKLTKLNPGDQLRHKVSKQDMWVINDDGKTVFLNSGTPTIKYPLDKILEAFEIVKRAK